MNDEWELVLLLVSEYGWEGELHPGLGPAVGQLHPQELVPGHRGHSHLNRLENLLEISFIKCSKMSQGTVSALDILCGVALPWGHFVWCCFALGKFCVVSLCPGKVLCGVALPWGSFVWCRFALGKFCVVLLCPG